MSYYSWIKAKRQAMKKTIEVEIPDGKFCNKTETMLIPVADSDRIVLVKPCQFKYDTCHEMIDMCALFDVELNYGIDKNDGGEGNIKCPDCYVFSKVKE